MRRVGRYILNAVMVLSLAMCLATVGLWVGARPYILLAGVNSATKGVEVGAYDAAAWVRLCLNDAAREPWLPRRELIAYDRRGYNGPPRDERELAVCYRPQARETFLGFAFEPDHEIGYTRRWVVRIPLVAVAALLATPPSILFAALARRRRRHSGGTRCPRCAYDLRATPDRCPECGMAKGAAC